METISVKHALISVSDKAGLVEFARALADEFEVNLCSTGGTHKTLKDAGIKVTAVEDVTHSPEILGGRVKTLHPAVFGGILARRDLPEHMSTLDTMNFPPFDLVVVNLYPFAATIRKEGVTEAECIEKIDIGGVALLRAAAKNFSAVTVVCSPGDYARVLDELRNQGGISGDMRRSLALKAFRHTADYDDTICRYFTGNEKFPEVLTLRLERKEVLRYGENPHQDSAFYTQPVDTELLGGVDESCVAHVRQLHGKQISYNNLSDTDAAFELVREFSQPAVSIIKHANPCGVAVGETPAEAYTKALECDPVSAFGGIVALNRVCDADTAKRISEVFTEVVIAPSYEKEAFAILSQKKNLRLLATGNLTDMKPALVCKSIICGMLFQDRDLGSVDADALSIVTEAKPSEEELRGLLFAWKVVKWVKSNAIVFTAQNRTLAIGAGQMSRIDAARFASQKARSSIAGSYMGSDAFFPFRDCVDFAAQQGVRAIIQPGGSVRDQDSIDACNEHGIIMVFTGMRHFRH